MSDLIDRQAAIDAVQKELTEWEHSHVFNIWTTAEVRFLVAEVILKKIPPSEPYNKDEWCDDCKEYDHEKHCCQRFNRVIRTTVGTALEAVEKPKTGMWKPYSIADGCIQCSVCGILRMGEPSNYCPTCGAKMKGVKDGTN